MAVESATPAIERANLEVARRAPIAQGMDSHGQPVNRNVNVARRRTRDVSEMLGIAKGMLADGVVTSEEASYLNTWISNHPDSLVTWPHKILHSRLQQYFADGRIDEEERRELAEVLAALIGGTASILLGYEAATVLPLDTPPPELTWSDQVYVFTGRFAFGTRTQCEREVARRRGVVDSNVTRRTAFLIIGTFGSEDWAHSSYGRKIQRAVELRESGLPIRIVGEDHWAQALEL
jgi:NAD-dependent DNA ligase